MKLILFFITVMAASSFADPTNRLSMTKGTAVVFMEWKKECECYDVEVEANKALGPFFTTADSVAKGLPELDASNIRRNPSSLLNTRYVLDQNLELLRDEEVDKREHKSQKP